MQGLLYDRVIGPVSIVADTEMTISAGGNRILVKLTAASGVTFNITGLAITGGAPDGVVVTFLDISNVSHTIRCAHDSVFTSTPANRFRNTGTVNFSLTGIGGVSYRYEGSASRWWMISHS